MTRQVHRHVHRILRQPIGRLCLCAAFAALPLMGCVPQDKYDQLLMANRSLEEQIVNLEDQRDEARTSLRSVQSALLEAQSAHDSLANRYETLSGTFDELSASNNDTLRRISSLELGPLPVEVETALMDLAMQHPDLLQFDAQRGMVRFASDVTFDLGSTELKSEAQTTITKLASILNDAAARDLEVQVVGHTDNVPIGRPSTREKHPTNVHLSVHRAIAVRDALGRAGVARMRMMVAGYGEFRPAVTNGTRGATENRRVEIYLKPMPELVRALPPTPAQKRIMGIEERETSLTPNRAEPMK